MGREARVAKNRKCRCCGDEFVNMNASQITMHGFVCQFEKETGIEVISMGDRRVEDVEPIIIP